MISEVAPTRLYFLPGYLQKENEYREPVTAAFDSVGFKTMCNTPPWEEWDNNSECLIDWKHSVRTMVEVNSDIKAEHSMVDIPAWIGGFSIGAYMALRIASYNSVYHDTGFNFSGVVALSTAPFYLRTTMNSLIDSIGRDWHGSDFPYIPRSVQEEVYDESGTGLRWKWPRCPVLLACGEVERPHVQSQFMEMSRVNNHEIMSRTILGEGHNLLSPHYLVQAAVLGGMALRKMPPNAGLCPELLERACATLSAKRGRRVADDILEREERMRTQHAQTLRAGCAGLVGHPFARGE
jgi:hypothetical protein